MLDAEYLREILDYEPETGAFTWKKKIASKVVVGTTAGGVYTLGYVVIGIGGRIYYAHRLAWLYMTGNWPAQVDHRDGDKANNMWANLRLATSQQNALNSKRPRTNTSGLKGVSWHKAAKKWAAAITIDGRATHLGLYEDAELAHAAYMAAASTVQPEFARGK